MYLIWGHIIFIVLSGIIGVIITEKRLKECDEVRKEFKELGTDPVEETTSSRRP